MPPAALVEVCGHSPAAWAGPISVVQGRQKVAAQGSKNKLILNKVCNAHRQP